ncbi:methyltransferase [bacterium]|nr:methyltransferase [bacterium]NCQ55875.1 methyltransferase [Candidatus Parcubacteria bacterium]NCS67583.1 methyltransferase [Candidatus Peregrinibacteria bacterium]NCS96252.1 methyltransferase [bacterium]
MLDVSAGKYQNLIDEWYDPTSLACLSEQIVSLESNQIEAARRIIANWVLKYFNAFYFPDDAQEPVLLAELVQAILALRLKLKQEPVAVLMGERCLFDFAKTAGLLEMVLKTKIREGNLALDLGSGTGVLTHAINLAALQQGVKMRVVGIEHDAGLVEKAINLNKALPSADRLSFVKASTTDPNTYQLLVQDQVLGVIVNENLPMPSARLLDPIEPKNDEPFLRNLEALAEAGIDMSQAAHVPKAIEVTRLFTNGQVETWPNLNPLCPETRALILESHRTQPATEQRVINIGDGENSRSLKGIGRAYYPYFPQDVFLGNRW